MAAVAPPLTAAEQQQLTEFMREFRYDQQYLQQKFWWYRNGDRSYTKTAHQIELDYDEGFTADRDRISARQVPRVDYQHGGRLNDTRRARLETRAENNRDFYGGGGNAFDANKKLNFAERDLATDEFRRATAMMTVKKNFTFVKILGAGGNGMVCLFKWTPSGNPQEQGHMVVMKNSILTEDNGTVKWWAVDDERAVSFRLLRALHITQPFMFRAHLGSVTTSTRAQHTVARNLTHAPGLLFLEYAKHGDMHHLLHRLVDEGAADRHLPPEALWRIFDCLVKGCIAMEYPPRYVPAGAILPTVGDPLPEVIPPGGDVAPVRGFHGFVHFDLDPKNIFLSGYDPRNDPMDPPHSQVPRFQIADFGLAQNSDFLWAPLVMQNRNALVEADERKDRWDLRLMAKQNWFLPEQFSVEWDQLDNDPIEGPLNAPPGTWPPWTRWPISSGPGRYSQRSNIWHIGMNMFCLLLLQEPDFPPVAGRMTSEEPAGVAYNAVPTQDQRWTYGYRLIENTPEGQEYRDNFTPALCEMIAKCLMHRQEHRPDLAQLQADVTAALGNPIPSLPARVRRFFGNDPPLPVPWYSAYTDVDLQNMDPFNPYPMDDEDPEDLHSPSPRPRKRRRTRQVPFEDRDYIGRIPK